MDTIEARSHLIETLGLKPGDTVYTVLRSVARSGMSRRMDVYVMRDNAPRWITGAVATLLGSPTNGTGMLVRGGGMDMGFHVAYSLSAKLFGDGCALSHRWI